MDSKLLREKIRNNNFNQPTCGFAKDYIQTNLVIVTNDYADDFEKFCSLNPKPCPIIEKLDSGSYIRYKSAPSADLRTDIVSYKKFEDGNLVDTLDNLIDEWRDDFVAFLLGCSFSFEFALSKEGIFMPHFEKNGNVAMYSTNIETTSTSFFSGPLVVSMRWIPEDKIEKVISITSKYENNHGAPIHVGDPSKIGINNLNKPDFGEFWKQQGDGDVPVFWACGVTPQVVLKKAKIPVVFTHSPGYMFVTDLKDEDK